MTTPSRPAPLAGIDKLRALCQQLETELHNHRCPRKLFLKIEAAKNASGLNIPHYQTNFHLCFWYAIQRSWGNAQGYLSLLLFSLDTYTHDTTTPTHACILDACCGSRMFWHNPHDPRAVYIDCRDLETTLCDGRKLAIHPDIIADFRCMPFKDARFRLVVFDPPHTFAGQKSWLGLKYGSLGRKTWKEDLKAGFHECFRVLEPGGVLIFKWCACDIPLKEVLGLSPTAPLIGTQGGRQGKTHFIVFLKDFQPPPSSASNPPPPSA